jgi:hypothetical protein
VVFQPSVILKQRINGTLPTAANGKPRLDNSSLRFRAPRIDFGVEAYSTPTTPRPPWVFGLSLITKAGSAFPRCRQLGRFCYQACEAHQCR